MKRSPRATTATGRQRDTCAAAMRGSSHFKKRGRVFGRRPAIMEATLSPSTIVDTLRARHLLHVLDTICEARGVTRDDVCSRRRTRPIALARHELWWHLHTIAPSRLGAKEIGRIFDRNRTSVLRGLHAYRRARRDESSFKPLTIEPPKESTAASDVPTAQP